MVGAYPKGDERRDADISRMIEEKEVRSRAQGLIGDGACHVDVYLLREGSAYLSGCDGDAGRCWGRLESGAEGR